MNVAIQSVAFLVIVAVLVIVIEHFVLFESVFVFIKEMVRRDAMRDLVPLSSTMSEELSSGMIGHILSVALLVIVIEPLVLYGSVFVSVTEMVC
jgi:hypothetical protein